MAKKVHQTVIICPDNRDEPCGISTANGKFIRKMEAIEAAGRAEEVEASVEGAREWEFDRKMFRMPVNRKSRVYTAAQKKAAIERLAAVRAKVKAAREEAAESEGKKPAKKATKTGSAKAAPVKKALPKKSAKPAVEEDDEEEDVEEEEIDDEEDEEAEDEEDDDEEEEEVVVKKHAKKH
jgi:hypothetical protein